MLYSFLCPFPCNHQILIDADDFDDAAIKLMRAGALRCRNLKYSCRCEKFQPDMSPMTDEELQQAVRICMREEQEVPEDGKDVCACIYAQTFRNRISMLHRSMKEKSKA